MAPSRFALFFGVIRNGPDIAGPLRKMVFLRRMLSGILYHPETRESGNEVPGSTMASRDDWRGVAHPGAAVAPIRARSATGPHRVHARASRLRTGVEMPENGTYQPLSMAVDFEALQEWTAGAVERGSPGAVSLLLHKHFLQELVEPGMRVLQVGSGGGIITRTLAVAGCRVVVAGMSAGQLQMHRTRSVELKIDDAVEGRILLDTRELSPILARSFDAVVCFGGLCPGSPACGEPAVADCARVCTPGGLVFLSVLSLWGAVHRYLEGGMEIPPPSLRAVAWPEDRTPRCWAEVHSRCRMYRAEELRLEALDAGLEVVAMSASNVLSMGWDPFLPPAGEDRERWSELLRLELAACRGRDTLDMGRRILLAGRTK